MCLGVESVNILLFSQDTLYRSHCLQKYYFITILQSLAALFIPLAQSLRAEVEMKCHSVSLGVEAGLCLS